MRKTLQGKTLTMPHLQHWIIFVALRITLLWVSRPSTAQFHVNKYLATVLQSIAEMDDNNPDSWVKLNSSSSDPTTNVTAQAVLTDNDRKLWDSMDKATFDTIAVVAGPALPEVEFWYKGVGWKSSRPSAREIREPGIAHDASTLRMGDYATSAAVDDEYRPYGSKNIYVTGAALFPTVGSWNPVLTACAYAQDLAKRLVKLKGEAI